MARMVYSLTHTKVSWWVIERMRQLLLKGGHWQKHSKTRRKQNKALLMANEKTTGDIETRSRGH